MHSADIILIWNSFLSAVAGTTPAWLHPKSITLLGPLRALGEEPSGTVYQLYHGLLTLKTMLFFTLKDISDIGAMQRFMDGKIVVLLQNIPLFHAVPVNAGWKQQSCCVSQVETEISECETFRFTATTEIRPWSCLPSTVKPPISVWQLTPSCGIPPSYPEDGSTCVKQTSTKMFGYSFAATSRYGSIMASAQCTGV